MCCSALEFLLNSELKTISTFFFDPLVISLKRDYSSRLLVYHFWDASSDPQQYLKLKLARFVIHWCCLISKNDSNYFERSSICAFYNQLMIYVISLTQVQCSSAMLLSSQSLTKTHSLFLLKYQWLCAD